MPENNTNQAWRVPPSWHGAPSCSRTFLDVGGFLYIACEVCFCVCNVEAIAKRETYEEVARPTP